MPRPYNKKTINDAIELCSVMPSEGHHGWVKVLRDLGLKGGDTSARLADAAVDAVCNALETINYPDMWPEAAALIASGWRIGDPVELLTVASTVPEPSAVGPSEPWLPVETDEIQSPLNEARSEIRETFEENRVAYAAAYGPGGTHTASPEESPRPDPVADAIEAGDAQLACNEMTSVYDDSPTEFADALSSDTGCETENDEPTVESDPSKTVDQPGFEYGGSGDLGGEG